MKLRTLFVTLALGIIACFNAAHAQVAPDPCTLYLCMAGISGYGSTGGSACTAPIAYWHASTPAGLAVYVSAVFVPPASYTARRAYLSTCKGAAAPNIAVLEAIMTQWGSEP